MTTVPYLDLAAQYAAIRDEIDGAIAAVIDASAFVRGPFVDEFERVFATAIGARHFLGTGNGTDALFVALKMLGMAPGDEVITAANSWISSAECISLCGATPVFADIDLDTHTIDPEDVAAKVTPRTRAIIPVHLFGQAADMGALTRIAEKHDLLVVEDCAQAHLATTGGQIVGTIGDAGAFSFYPGKNLGAYGDAGGIATDDVDLDARMRMFADHGSDPTTKHDHRMEGINSRLDGLQAALLAAKLRHLKDWTALRQSRARLYDGLLAGVGDVVTPRVRDGNDHVYHIYCIRTAKRDELRDHLHRRGIATGIHYPTALPFLRAYEHLGGRPEDYPVAHRYQGEILSLPIYPELSDEDVRRVADAISDFFASTRA